jgi:hypothetical protein
LQTNYSDDVPLSIDLNPIIDFIATIKRPDGGMEGRGVDHSITSYVTIPKVDVGAEKSFVFYFSNQEAGSRHFVNAEPRSGRGRSIIFVNGPISGSKIATPTTLYAV